MTLAPKYTHNIRIGSSARLFNVEPCEVCGRECEAPNATTLVRIPRHQMVMGQRLANALPELGACDALGGIAVCPDCYRDDNDDSDLPSELMSLDEVLAARGNEARAILAQHHRGEMKAAAVALGLKTKTEARKMKRPALEALLATVEPSALTKAFQA